MYIITLLKLKIFFSLVAHDGLCALRYVLNQTIATYFYIIYTIYMHKTKTRDHVKDIAKVCQRHDIGLKMIKT